MDAKATVQIGSFDRGGKNRVPTVAADHDFTPKARVTPYGIFLPQLDELFLYFTQSKVTSDFIVDRLEEFWQSQRQRFPHVQTLVLNQDKGPENHSRRTQFMKRIVEFSQKYKLNIRLAYYPPYHSKYNPIERVWAVLENHWNGSILDEIETALRYASSMTWNGKAPVVKLVTTTYETGVKLTKKAMTLIENQIERLSNFTQDNLSDLGRWFVDICCRNT